MNISIFDDTMADMSWDKIDEYRKKDVPVLFPLGALGAHGTHLPLAGNIYFSLAVARKIKEEIEKSGRECLIAPPFYWGINTSTSAFPGSFSLKPELMEELLFNIFEDMQKFGFERIYCVNPHLDHGHMAATISACKNANMKLGTHVRMLMEPYLTKEYGLTGTESYCLFDKAVYSRDMYSYVALGDVHAGGYDTQVLNYLYPGMVDEEAVKDLPDHALDDKMAEIWAKGGEEVREMLPLGYAGSPAKYKNYEDIVPKVLDILCRHFAGRIV